MEMKIKLIFLIFDASFTISKIYQSNFIILYIVSYKYRFFFFKISSTI